MTKKSKKGSATKAIKEVVEELKDEGMDVEVVEVVSTPAKKEVKKEVGIRPAIGILTTVSRFEGDRVLIDYQ